MDLIKFPVSDTTIFPVANSRAGGQILSEYNQRVRDSVENHSNIPYVCSPSYTHSLDDFKIYKSGSNLKITGGSAIVHGHFVRLTSEITITPAELSGVSGRGLCIGLRAMYMNPTTIAATLQIENSNNFYEGIKVVILPAGNPEVQDSFKLPEFNGTYDSNGYPNPTSEDQVTAHLLLGTFDFQAGAFNNITPNEHRIECLDAERIGNIDQLLDAKYVSRDNLDPNRFYVMAGKGAADDDYWTDATDGSIVWDPNPQLRDVADTVKKIWLKNENVTGSDILESAEFRYDTDDDQLKLVLPHKTLPWNQSKYYPPREVVLPAANRATGTGGVLDAEWVNFINGLDTKIATMYRMPGGKMRKFIEVLTSKDQLPKIPISFNNEQSRTDANYDTRFQYSFNLLQTQLATLDSKFKDFQSKLESEWITSVTASVTSSMDQTEASLQASITALDREINAIKGQLSGVSSEVTTTNNEMLVNYESYYKALVQRTNDLMNDITELKNRWMSSGGGEPLPDAPTKEEFDQLVAQVKENMDLVGTQITAIQLSVDASLASCKSTIDAINQALYGDGSSSGDITSLATSINLLQKQYDYLYDAVHDLYDGIDSEVQKATSTLYSNLWSQCQKTIDELMQAFAEKYNINVEWEPGDYVLVAQDQTITTQTSDLVTFPSTMYVVVPGKTTLESKNVASYYDVYTTDLSTPISRVKGTTGTSTKDVFSDAMDTYTTAVDTLMRRVPVKFLYGYELTSNNIIELSSEADAPDFYNSNDMIQRLYNSNTLINGVRGTPGRDYFVLRYRYPISDPIIGTYTDEISGDSYDNIQYQIYRWVSVFFTLNQTNDKIELDIENPVILTGGTPYAEEDRVGGFLNVASDTYGGGYVSRDERGHLRVNDFELLAAGVSAYQLGEDRSEGAGLDISELQDVFDQYVNQRIAFPNDNQLYKAAEKGLRTDVITISLNISSSSEGTLNIYDIDSRFNTAVNLQITGSATENVVINVTNCQRLKISLDETSHPTIFIKNVCLYYDPDVIDRIASIEDLSLWYTRFETTDPKLEIDGMTVICQEKLEPKGTDNFWTQASSNDNSYAYALRQLTFASDGTIIGLGVAVTDTTTNNIIPNSESVFARYFTLPQSIGLAYPVTRLKKQLKVTGDFITAYYTTLDDGPAWSVKHTTFTILTQKYLTYADVKESIQGTISFFTRTSIVKDETGAEPGSLIALGNEYTIDGWDPGAYHIFYGGAIE